MVATHPTSDELADFALGKLDSHLLERIGHHLEDCSNCRSLAEQTSGDTLTALLQDANTELNLPRSTILIPPELANHPRYRIVRQLGIGGMGTVWLAEHKMMNRRVALKIIRPEFLTKTGAVERFHREVAAAARLHHPHIVAAYDAEQAGQTHFLVMEFIEGIGLDELLKQRGTLPVNEAVRIIKQVASALAHAHEAGLVHRDVKPGNIMLANDGRAKVLDFGLAMIVADDHTDMTLTGANLVVGTPDMIAPEQAEHPHAADARSDVYSLGCTFYQLLTGQPPFPGASVLKKLDAHRFEEPRSVTEFRTDVDENVQSVIRKMMAKKPAARFQSVGEVALALDAKSPASSVTNKKPPRRLLTLVAGLLASLILLLGVVIYRINTDSGELVIEASEDVEVIIKQGGKFVTLIDTKTQNKVELKSGHYQLQLKDAPNLQLNVSNATLTRGSLVLAKITKKESSRAEANQNFRYYYEAVQTAEGPIYVKRAVPVGSSLYRDSPLNTELPSANLPSSERYTPLLPSREEPGVPSAPVGPSIPSPSVEGPSPNLTVPRNPTPSVDVGPSVTRPIPDQSLPSPTPIDPVLPSPKKEITPVEPVKPTEPKPEMGFRFGLTYPAKPWSPQAEPAGSGKAIVLPSKYSNVNGFTFSPDGRLAVVTWSSQEFHILETVTGQVLTTYRANSSGGQPHCWCFSADSTRILFLMPDQEERSNVVAFEWTLKTGAIKAITQPFRGPAYTQIYWPADEKTIVLSSSYGDGSRVVKEVVGNVIHVYSIAENRIIWEEKLEDGRLFLPGPKSSVSRTPPGHFLSQDVNYLLKWKQTPSATPDVGSTPRGFGRFNFSTNVINLTKPAQKLEDLNIQGDSIRGTELANRGWLGIIFTMPGEYGKQLGYLDRETLKPTYGPIKIPDDMILAERAPIGIRKVNQELQVIDLLRDEKLATHAPMTHLYVDLLMISPDGRIAGVRAENGWNFYQVMLPDPQRKPKELPKPDVDKLNETAPMPKSKDAKKP